MIIDWKDGIMAVVVLLVVFVTGLSMPFWRSFVVIVIVWWLLDACISRWKRQVVSRRAKESVGEIDKRH